MNFNFLHNVCKNENKKTKIRNEYQSDQQV